MWTAHAGVVSRPLPRHAGLGFGVHDAIDLAGVPARGETSREQGRGVRLAIHRPRPAPMGASIPRPATTLARGRIGRTGLGTE